MLDSGSNRLGSNPGWTTAMKIKIYLILFFLNYYSFSKEEDYNKLVLNTSNDNFSESVKIFEDVQNIGIFMVVYIIMHYCTIFYLTI